MIEADDRLEPAALAAMIAAAERGVRPDRLDEGARRSVRLSLEHEQGHGHEHLRRLAAVRAVRERRGGYGPGENAAALVAVTDATAAAL